MATITRLIFLGWVILVDREAESGIFVPLWAIFSNVSRHWKSLFSESTDARAAQDTRRTFVVKAAGRIEVADVGKPSWPRKSELDIIQNINAYLQPLVTVGHGFMLISFG